MLVAVISLVALAAASVGHAMRPDAVVASCPAGSKPAVIAGNFKCLKAGRRCKVRYQAAYKKYGFRCVAGRLKRGTGPRGGGTTQPPPPPSPPATPPPAIPPPPTFQPGHYKGQTSQNESFEFDVTVDYAGVRGLRTGQINLGCTPALHIFNYGFDFGSYSIPLAADGSFSFDQRYSATITFDDGARPTQDEAIINGHISGAVAVGNLLLHTIFSHQGTSYDCGSGLQTWTATRVG